MRRLVAFLVLAGVTAAILVGPAGAADQIAPPFPMNPWPAEKQKFAFWVDTIQAHGFKVKPASICVESNVFARGNSIAWRFTVTRTPDGKVLTGKDISAAVVKIPGQPDLRVTYRPMGTPSPASPWVWGASWVVPDNYPLGLLDYTIQVKIKKTGETATYKPFAGAAAMQIVP